MILLHTEKFEGDTITVVSHGPDYQVKINDGDFGAYMSIFAGVNAAKESITRELKRDK